MREALDKGADLTAQEPNYKLPALAQTRRMMKEFRKLGLDPVKFHPMERLLVVAAKTDKDAGRQPQHK